MKKILSLVLAFAVCLSIFAGCTLISTDDSDVVIATVNGENILKSEFNEVYNYYYYIYTNYYGYDSSTAQSSLESMKSDILADLVEQKLLKQKAKEAGYFDFTDEQIAEAQATIDEDKQSYIDDLVEQYTTAFEGQEVKGKNEGETDEEYFTRVAEEKYLDTLKQNDTSVEEMLQEQLESNAVDKFKEDKLATVTVLEADIMSEYETEYETQLQELSTDALFVSAYNNKSITSATSGETVEFDTILYYRAGYSLVQQILLSFDDEDADTLEGISSTISEYEEEIEDRKTTIETETDETVIEEAKTALELAEQTKASLEEQYAEALEAAKAKIQDKVDSVYASVKDGDEANFISVMIENTGDTGMNTEEAAKEGYLVGPEDNMVPEFSTAAQALSDGEISEPVATYYGMHIIRCIKKLPEGKVAYDDVKAELEESLKAEKQDTEWENMLSDWKEESKIKEYEDRL